MTVRAVVLGGGGFLGSWVCEALLDQGADVVCVDNFVTGSRRNLAHLQSRRGFELLEGDVTS